jgi:hypothetical protein
MVKGNAMGESSRENHGVPCQEMQLQFTGVPDERSDAPMRRAEVRSMLVRLLVTLYVECHKELIKDAA